MPVAAINARLNPDQEPYLGRDGALQPINNLHGYHSSAGWPFMSEISTRDISTAGQAPFGKELLIFHRDSTHS